MEWIPVLVIAVLALVIIVRNIYVVQQSRAYVVERLGAFSNVWTVGIHFKVPFVERGGQEGQPQRAGARLSAPARHHEG